VATGCLGSEAYDQLWQEEKQQQQAAHKAQAENEEDRPQDIDSAATHSRPSGASHGRSTPSYLHPLLGNNGTAFHARSSPQQHKGVGLGNAAPGSHSAAGGEALPTEAPLVSDSLLPPPWRVLVEGVLDSFDRNFGALDNNRYEGCMKGRAACYRADIKYTVTCT
jgi:hypothetical protein